MISDKVIVDVKVKTVKASGEYRRAVFKFPPSKRTIHYYNNSNYFLSFPIIYFSLSYRIKEGKYYYSALRPAFGVTHSDELYYAAFPNTWDDLHLCMGINRRTAFDSLEDLSRFVLDSFWTSKFGTNLGGNPYVYKALSILGDLVAWDKLTKSEPQWTPTIEEMKRMDNKHLMYFREKNDSI